MVNATVDPTATVQRHIVVCAGNAVPWYDFALHGAFAAVLASVFFPGHGQLGGLAGVYSYAAVGVLAPALLLLRTVQVSPSAVRWPAPLHS